MAGLPELQGVFGTFSGRRGLNLQPLEMKQRQQMFLAQLQQEQQRLAAQQSAQTRGLDLEQQRMDLGTKENELARAFQQNLMTQRQGFDEKQAQLQREAAQQAQQAAIQEAQRAQGAGQQFAREEGAAERGFRGEQAGLDRDMQRQAMEQRRAEFEKSFGLDAAKFDFMKDMTWRDEIRKERAEEMNRELHDLQVALQKGDIDMRQAQVGMVLLQTEALGRQLEQELKDKGMDPKEFGALAGKLSNGEKVPPEMWEKLQESPKAMQSVVNLMTLIQSAQEAGLVAEELTPEAKEARKTQREGVAKTAVAAAGGGMPDKGPLTNQELKNLRGTFTRRNKGEGFFEGGEDIPGALSPAQFGLAAVDAYEALASEDGADVEALRNDIAEVIGLTRKIKSGVIGGVFSDTAMRTGNRKITGLTTAQQDRLDELIESLKANGIELVD